MNSNSANLIQTKSILLIIIAIVIVWFSLEINSTSNEVVNQDVSEQVNIVFAESREYIDETDVLDETTARTRHKDAMPELDFEITSHYADLDISLDGMENASDNDLDEEIRSIEEYLKKNNVIARLNSGNTSLEQQDAWGKLINRAVSLRSIKLQRKLKKIEAEFNRLKKIDPIAKAMQ